jgi:putative ABC transport system permease protein
MNWWSRLVRRGRMEEQLEKELRFHLDQHAQDLIDGGYARDEARRQVRLALGGPEQVKEKCRDARGTRWLEDAARNAHHAFRTFRQHPGFAAIAILILGLGIGATTVMFAVVDSVLLRSLPFPDPARLVTVHGFDDQFGEFWGFSKPDLDDLKRASHSLAIAGWTYGGGTISKPGDPEYVIGRQISAEFFPVLGIRPLHGRAFQPNDDRPAPRPSRSSVTGYGSGASRMIHPRLAGPWFTMAGHMR